MALTLGVAVGTRDADESSPDEFARLVAGCSFEELEEAAVQLHNLKTAAEARLCTVVGEIAARRAYEIDGCRDISSWLEARLMVSRRAAKCYSQLGTSLRSLPHLKERLERAEVSIDQMAPIALVASADNDEELAERVVSMSPREAEVLAKRLSSVAAADEREAHDRRHLSLRHLGQETRISGILPLLEGEKVKHALAAIAERYGKNAETGLYDPYPARLADAFVDLASNSLALERDSDKATIVIHVDPDTLSGDGPAETGDGAFLPAETARRAACDARVQTWTKYKGCRPIDIGRLTRTIPAPLRNYLRRRDLGCRFPGCGRTRLCEGHHIVHWGNKGPTNRDNLLELCRWHHHLVHEGGWSIEGDPEERVAFVSPFGRRLDSHRVPFPEEIEARLFADRSGGT